MDPEIKKEFQDLKGGFQGMRDEFKDIKVGFQGMKQDIDDLTEITREAFERVEERMATKEDLGKLKLDLVDAMAEKNAELRGDLVVLMRKEDTKIISLVELLKKKTVITENEAKAILTLEPFPRFFV